MTGSGDRGARLGARPSGQAVSATWPSGATTARLGVSRQTRRQLLHLLAGGLAALLYLGLATLVTSSIGLTSRGQVIAAASAPVAVALAAAVGLTRPVADLEAALAHTLLGTQAGQRARGRIRPAMWHVIHAGAGGLAGLMLATIPVVAVIAGLASWGIGPAAASGLPGWSLALGRWTPAAAAAVLVLVLYIACALGAGLARLAPRLLGPSAADQLAAAEHRARQLAGRNRAALELHDSIGHALSIVSIQAAAAQRLLTADPAFVDRALTSVADTARRALEDLDYVLGILREPGEPVAAGAPIGPAATSGSGGPGPSGESSEAHEVAEPGKSGDRETTEPGKSGDRETAEPGGTSGAGEAPEATESGGAARSATLADLGQLMSLVEQAGADVTAGISADLGRLPFAVSREAYRIVQEGLTNVLRHGGSHAATLRIEASPDRLRIQIVNALVGEPGHGGRSTGRGLAGIAERTAALGGAMSAGPAAGSWRLEVELPLRPGP